jgi:hypothetical protein
MRRLDIPSLQDDGYIFLWVIFQLIKGEFNFILFVLGDWSCNGTW